MTCLMRLGFLATLFLLNGCAVINFSLSPERVIVDPEASACTHYILAVEMGAKERGLLADALERNKRKLFIFLTGMVDFLPRRVITGEMGERGCRRLMIYYRRDKLVENYETMVCPIKMEESAGGGIQWEIK